MIEQRTRCRGCARAIPHDAAFCIYCAAPTGAVRDVAPTTAPRPATGATIRLRPADAPRPQQRPQPPTPTPRRSRTVVVTPMPHQRRARKPKPNDQSGIVFIIGVLFLFATGVFGTSVFWPSILALIGITRWMKHTARGKPYRALSRLVFWVGLAGLWFTPFFWTGALVLLFVSHIIGKQRHIGWT